MFEVLIQRGPITQAGELVVRRPPFQLRFEVFAVRDIGLQGDDVRRLVAGAFDE